RKADRPTRPAIELPDAEASAARLWVTNGEQPIVLRSSFLTLPDPFREAAKRDAAMGHRNLFWFGNFRQRSPVRWIEKNRVVAEAAAAARRLSDRAFDNAGRFVRDVAVLATGQRRDEPRPPRRTALSVEPPIDFRESFGIGRVAAEKTSGLHAWLAAE